MNRIVEEERNNKRKGKKEIKYFVIRKYYMLAEERCKFFEIFTTISEIRKSDKQSR